jgi:hypothetical protein
MCVCVCVWGGGGGGVDVNFTCYSGGLSEACELLKAVVTFLYVYRMSKSTCVCE